MSNFVTIDSYENKIKLKNLFNVGIFIGFVWILFHFTIIYFFGLVLESVFLTGLFLGIGNLIAIFVDIPIGVLQKYIKPRTFLLIGAFFMLLAILIFIKFIFFEGISNLFLPAGSDAIDLTINYVGNFLGSGLNIFLIILSACLYGLIKETFDVTTLSYIFNNSTPSDYASLISKYSINFGIGSMIGLIFSGILLSFNIKIAIFIFLFIVILFLLFIFKYFDNSSDTIKLDDIKKIKLDVIKSDLTKKSQDFVKNINTKTLIDISQKSRIILLKPVEIKNNIDFLDVFKTSKQEFLRFIYIIINIPINFIIIGFISVILLYGFWDTFVSTFLVEFLGKILDSNKDNFILKSTGGMITGYVFLGLIVIPAFLFQDFFIKFSKKIGVFKVVLFGLFISSISMFCFGLFDGLGLVILFGLLNSIGYAASMPIAQSIFSQIYNIEYSKKYNLKQIDSTLSASPLKIILNAANVIGVVFGGLFISVLSFNGFFIFFSLVLFGVFLYGIINKDKFDVSKIDSNNINNSDFIEDKSKEDDIDKEFI